MVEKVTIIQQNANLVHMVKDIPPTGLMGDALSQAEGLGVNDKVVEETSVTIANQAAEGAIHAAAERLNTGEAAARPKSVLT